MSLTNKNNNCCQRSLTQPESFDRRERNPNTPREELVVDNLVAINGLFGNVEVENVIIANRIQPTAGNIMSIPNVKYNVDTTNTVLGPSQIKASRFFANSNNFTLNADSSIDGTEIVIYNSGTSPISVSGVNLTTMIVPGSSITLAYLNLLDKWIVVS